MAILTCSARLRDDIGILLVRVGGSVAAARITKLGRVGRAGTGQRALVVLLLLGLLGAGAALVRTRAAAHAHRDAHYGRDDEEGAHAAHHRARQRRQAEGRAGLSWNITQSC